MKEIELKAVIAYRKEMHIFSRIEGDEGFTWLMTTSNNEEDSIQDLIPSLQSLISNIEKDDYLVTSLMVFSDNEVMEKDEYKEKWISA